MNIQIKDLLKAGVHFGHQTQKWNPKMKSYIYTDKKGIHILDLQKTAECLQKALEFINQIAQKGGSLVFIGTKKQAGFIVQKAAKDCNQYYVTKRWLGGTFTNFSTIKDRMDHIRKIDRMREKGDLNFFHKKEKANIEKRYNKLIDYLGGIKEMKELPKCVFVLDVNKDLLAVKEANRLKIPVVALVDTNSDPSYADYPIPANDDAIKSIEYFCTKVSEAYNEGYKEWEKRKVEKKETDQKEEKQETKNKEDGEKKLTVVKKRQLVAAGTADDVEIQEEISKEKTEEKPKSEGEKQ